jgi:hypothetical protein
LVRWRVQALVCHQSTCYINGRKQLTNKVTLYRFVYLIFPRRLMD